MVERAEPGERKVRSDAVRSRAILLAAFTELVRERGDAVTMVDVARRAGVGQGTLYRHFPTRASLAAAVFEDAQDELARTVGDGGQDDSDAFYRLLAAATGNQVRMHALTRMLQDGPESEQLISRLLTRTDDLFGRALTAARAAGTVRDDLRLEDVLAVMTMVEGLLGGSAVSDPDRALDLLRFGIAPRSSR